MSRLDTASMLTALRNARRETIVAWSPDLDSESAPHLLNALLDVEMAIVALEKHENDSGEPSEISGLVGALASKARVSQ